MDVNDDARCLDDCVALTFFREQARSYKGIRLKHQSNVMPCANGNSSE